MPLSRAHVLLNVLLSFLSPVAATVAKLFGCVRSRSNTTFDAVATSGAIILGLVTYDCDFDQDESITPCTPSVVFQVLTALRFLARGRGNYRGVWVGVLGMSLYCFFHRGWIMCV